MDFFTMKRKDLQRLCKKHGIRANLKNIEMAEKLSLIYKEKENENRVSRRLRNVKDKSNAEIIVLDSDSDNEVQMEAPEIVAVAEKDSNEMNNVNVEHFLDELHSSGLKDSVEETEKFLATSPLSKVKSSDLNVHRTVDSVCILFSNEKTNVDELHSSGLKYSLGEPDQSLVTSLLSEVKSSDLNIHHMVYSGTVGGNADVSEVKSASSQQMSRGQEESQMKLQGTAAGHVDACEVISESLQMISQGLEESPMKFTPERRDNVRPFYAEEDMEMSVNVLEQFGNYMMIGENSYGTPVQFLPTSDLNIHKMVVKDTCEEGGMLKLSEETCMVADPEECIGFSPEELEESTTKGTEAKAYFDQTTHGDVMETYNRKESMVDKEHIEDNQELSPATPTDLDVHHMVDSGTAAGHADDCEVKSASLQGQEEAKMNLTPERNDTVGTFDVEVNMHMSVSKEQSEDNLELDQAAPSQDLDVLEEFGNYMMTREDSYKTKLNSPPKGLPIASEEKTIIFSPKLDDSSMVHKETEIEMSFPLNHERDSIHTCEEEILKLSEETCMDADPEDCIGFFDNSGVGGVGVEDQNESYTASNKRKRSDVVDTNSDVDVKEGELVPTVSQPSEMMSCNFSLQQLFATDTCEEEMLELSEKEKTCMVADLEACIGFSPDKLEASTTKGFEAETYFDQTTPGDVMETYNGKESMVDKEHIEDNQELSPATPTDLDVQNIVDSGTAAGHADDCEVKSASLQGREEAKMNLTPERSDTVGTFDVEVNMHMSVSKEQSEDNLELQAAPCEDVNVLEEFGNNMMAGEDPNGAPVQFMPTSDLNIQEMVADPEDCIGFFDNSGVGGVGVEDENESYTVSSKRKRTDVVDTNSDEEVKAGELVPTVSHPSEMMSCNFGLQQLFATDTCEEGMLKLSEKTCIVADPETCFGFSPDKLEASTTKGFEAETYFDQTTLGDVMETYNRKESMVDKEHIEDNQELSPAAPTDLDDHHMVDSDTASGDEDAYKTKLNSPPKCLPIASEEKTIIFSPKLDDSSMVHKETEIEMSFPLNHERDSIHTCEEEILKTCINADPVDCIGFFDNSGVGGVGVEDENESYTASNKRKRSDVVDTNSDEEVEAGELVPTVSQPSEMMSCNFGLQQLFATDICEEEMLKLSEKEKTSMVADLEACIGSLKHLDTATTKVSEADRYFDPNILGNVVTETCRIDNGEKQNNQEDCFSAQGEVSKFFDNSDVGADELVQTAPPQPSETESCDFSLQQLFASDIASEDEDAYQKKLDSPSMATPTSSGEKNMIFTPKLDEPKMTFQCERSSDNVGSVYFEESNQMSVSKEQIEDHKELSSAQSEDNLELHHAAPREDVKVLEEFGNYMTVGEDSDGRPIQFLPTSDHNIHKMVVRDTCEEEMLELSEKTCMVADPKEDCISPLEEVSKFVENSYVYDDIGGVGAVDENQPHMTSRKRKSSDEDDNIEMSLPQKRARDNSIGTCDMKENINIDKMEEVGSIMSKTKFAKRQPLQDLQQN